MNDTVRRAVLEDISRIQEIYHFARNFMVKTGNPTQWGTQYPPLEMLQQDILEGNLYVISDNDGIHGVFYFYIGDDPTYTVIENGAWHHNGPYGTIHRIAGDGSGGILKTAVSYAKQQIAYLRIDTHEDNWVMQHALEKQGFQRCGIIYIEDGTPRIAYDLLT